MENDTAMDVESEQEYDIDKIRLLPGSAEDGTASSFQIVEFCGYSIPHPSENKLNVRIQTYGNITALEALHQGMDNLSELCGHVEEAFTEKVEAGRYASEEP
ncbi:uncharacterized protein CXQ87_001212 [Candidozyma duobushaemuli]|uniref:DNA-directed RNA polymerase RBP11-like dimerisation domain-containing protein n=1 Tax=Candidozyma duobushaemuli TaxID=1231522 RepID=A0A2V1AKP1_9ASCO|nr:uncharacterized protein CXQ87_001212 [[Candida] duobushaemulonis]PVH18292.1 hypothetical protein CXQ87_001212 [[Candida] duobushaemulonis]